MVLFNDNIIILNDGGINSQIMGTHQAQIITGVI